MSTSHNEVTAAKHFKDTEINKNQRKGKRPK